MNEIVRSRLLVLVTLTVIGVGLAGGGVAVGLAGPLSTTGPSAEFVVSEGDVTVSTGDRSEPVVENLSGVTEVTIEETDAGQFTVRTRTDSPLTDAERRRARAIATDNATVALALDGMDAYELSVEPVYRVNRTASTRRTFEIRTDSNRTDGVFRGEVVDDETGTGDSDGGTVTVERAPDHVDDRAVVRVRDPDRGDRHDLRYTVDVNLANGTVTGITDWAAIRRESATDSS
ncbi:hypothetical protein [Haloarcula litorea]|uniref:hypothetical protein n=1 Tax=Haloarcula litorea TaxID=3032579 RepID=UPI0023E8F2D0|nr:hypothetical protein [Halomicroarcula sp. GDY20]